MEAAIYRLNGSEYIGAFATATDKFAFVGGNIEKKGFKVIEEVLHVKPVPVMISDSNMIGLLARANSNGILLSNLAFNFEIENLKKAVDINVGVLESNLNAIGNNIIANDKIAIVNPDYSADAMKQISDILGVESVKAEIGGMKTIGANNILTNRGFVINNRSTDAEKEKLDGIVGFKSVRTTANRGSIAVGLSAIANSSAIMIGSETTGYELGRLLEALEQ
ncbi:MAG: translation initiation factor IF-6 [Candidatus Micrarchaeaceae archaeon]